MNKLTIIKSITLALVINLISCNRSKDPASTASAEKSSDSQEETTKNTVADDNLTSSFLVPTHADRQQYANYLAEKEKIYDQWIEASKEILNGIEVFAKNTAENKVRWREHKSKLANKAKSDFSPEKIQAKAIALKVDLDKQVTLHIHIVNKIADKEVAGEDTTKLLAQDKKIIATLIKLNDQIDQFENNKNQLSRDAINKSSKNRSTIGIDPELDKLLIKYEEMYQTYCSKRKTFSLKYAELIKQLTPIDVNYGYMANNGNRHYIELYNHTSEAREVNTNHVLIKSKDLGFIIDFFIPNESSRSRASAKNIHLKPYQSIFVEVRCFVSEERNTHVYECHYSSDDLLSKDHATLFQTMKSYAYEMRHLRRSNNKPKVIGYYLDGSKYFSTGLVTSQISEKYRKSALEITRRELEEIKLSKTNDGSLSSSYYLERKELSLVFNQSRSELSRKYRDKRDPESRKEYTIEVSKLTASYRSQMRELAKKNPPTIKANPDSNRNNTELELIKKQYLALDDKSSVPSSCLLVLDAVIEYNDDRYVKLRNTSKSTITNAYIKLTEKKSKLHQICTVNKSQILPGDSIYIKVKSASHNSKPKKGYYRPRRASRASKSSVRGLLYRAGNNVKIISASSLYSGTFVINSDISQLE